ncbi:MAG: molybdenum cofactor biosynthesis protein MoaE [Desulfurococcus sp.]|nr:molybdenum cofactor biosynthesis protein MoaE [Desulfurococcus sp.]
MCYVEVRLLSESEDISLDKLLDKLRLIDEEHAIGAVSMFIGLVKGDLGDTRVYKLEYSAIEELVLKKLEEIAREVCSKYSLKAIMIYHRLGGLNPGESTIYIVAAGVSRNNSNPAMIEALERVKREAPIFKLEKRSDGEYWVVGDGARFKRTSS